DRDARPGNETTLVTIDVFTNRLARVVRTRRDLFVVARTHAMAHDDLGTRAAAFADAGADCVLINRPSSLSLVVNMTSHGGTVARRVCRVAVNQYGEGSPLFTLGELGQAGVSIAVYGSSCVSAAARAITRAMESLRASDGLLVGSEYAAPHVS